MSATVLSVTLLPNRGGGHGNWVTSKTRRFQYFLVVLNSSSATAEDDIIVSAYTTGPGPDTLPIVGDSHPNWTNLVALTITPVPVDGDMGSTNWIVSVEYGTNVYNINLPPWQWLDRRSSSTVEYTRVLARDFSTLDANGLPAGIGIQNAAFDPVYPPAHFTLHNQLLTIRRARQYADFNPGDADACIGTVNLASFIIRGVTYPANSCLLKGISWTDENYSDPSNISTSYYDITLTIEVTKQVDVLHLVLANTGLYYLSTPNTASSKQVITRNAANNGVVSQKPAAVPQYLNADGTQYTGTTPGTAQVISFQKSAIASWSAAIT